MAVVPEGGKGSVRRDSDAPKQKLSLGRLKPGEVKTEKEPTYYDKKREAEAG